VKPSWADIIHYCLGAGLRRGDAVEEVGQTSDRRRELHAQSLLDDDRGGGDSVRAGENVAMI
jgi:hypothetical protein